MSSGAVQHAVVIGGTRGLGQAVAARFLARGCDVTIVSRQKPPAELAPKCRHVTADLEALTDGADLAAAIAAQGGPVRYLVFCQRYRGQRDPWQGEWQVGLTATKLLTESLAPHFAADGDRAIAVASSVYAEFVGGSQPASYHVVKAGLNQLVRYYAWTLGRNGIRVNAIMPLTYLKPESQARYLNDQNLLDMYERLVPLRRLGTVEESASVLEFLCSEKASFVNGQCIFVDGGASVIWPEEVAQSLAKI
jgi:NAD(P)-dependent dehydrogenase (short-subunit alcohol dehydrogenase family)